MQKNIQYDYFEIVHRALWDHGCRLCLDDTFMDLKWPFILLIMFVCVWLYVVCMLIMYMNVTPPTCFLIKLVVSCSNQSQSECDEATCKRCSSFLVIFNVNC